MFKRDSQAVFCILLFVTFSIYIAQTSFAEELPLEFVLAGIQSNDEKIKCVESIYSITRIGKGGYVLAPRQHWIKNGDKEFIHSVLQFPDPQKADAFQKLDEKFAYDGTIMRTLQSQPDHRGGEFLGGLIREPAGDEFITKRTPWTFLGGDLSSRRLSLSMTLRDAENVKIEESLGNVVVISGDIYLYQKSGEKKFPQRLKVWIDTSRGFRPIQIETYTEAIPNEWVLYFKISGVELSLIEGDIYVPVVGIMSTYSRGKPTYSGGYTDDSILTVLEEERFKYVSYNTPELVAPSQRMEVESIKVNHNVPDEAFVLQYEPGTSIYDEFAHIGYKVGSPEAPTKRALGPGALEEHFTLTQVRTQSSKSPQSHQKNDDAITSAVQTHEDNKPVRSDEYPSKDNVHEPQEHMDNPGLFYAIGGLFFIVALFFLTKLLKIRSGRK